MNADGLLSTGQGVLGHNMFAYCGNNPVSFCDINGECRVCVVGEEGPCADVFYYNKYNNSNKTVLKSYQVCNIPYYSEPNSIYDLFKDGKLYQRRWFDENGFPLHDRDYTNHGHPKQHPVVPHDHHWNDKGDGTKKRDDNWTEPDPSYSDDDIVTKSATVATIGAALIYGTWVGIKWIAAVVTSVPAGGSSLIYAAVTP